MRIDKISAAEVESNSVERLANRPGNNVGFGKGGLSAEQLKSFFSALAKLSINKVNEIIDAFGLPTAESELLHLLYTSLADENDDECKMTLARWIDQVQDRMKRVQANMQAVENEAVEATIEMLAPDQAPQVAVSRSEEGGQRKMRIHFSVPKGEGRMAKFCVIDDVLCARYDDNGPWEEIAPLIVPYDGKVEVV